MSAISHDIFLVITAPVMKQECAIKSNICQAKVLHPIISPQIAFHDMRIPISNMPKLLWYFGIAEWFRLTKYNNFSKVMLNTIIFWDLLQFVPYVPFMDIVQSA